MKIAIDDFGTGFSNYENILAAIEKYSFVNIYFNIQFSGTLFIINWLVIICTTELLIIFVKYFDGFLKNVSYQIRQMNF